MIGRDAYEYTDFLALHKAQLVHAGIPPHYYRTIFEKVEMEKYDSGDYFIMMTDGDSWEVQTTTPVDPGDANTIFLVDHCWTFHADQVKKCLRGVPGLAQRVSGLTEVGYPDVDGYESSDEADEAIEGLVEELAEQVWTLAETYTIQKDEEKLTVCYLMDELGSRIRHSETPNVKMAPFFHITKQFAVTLMWPVEGEIPAETHVTRDVTFGEENPHKRAARLAIFEGSVNVDRAALTVDRIDKLNPYKMYGRKEQTLPESVPEAPDHPVSKRIKDISVHNPLKVWTDLDFMADAVTDLLFAVVGSQDEADFVSTSTHFDQFKRLYENTPAKIINQFPNENVICCKDLLLKVVRRCTIEEKDQADEVIIERLNSASPSWAEDLHPSWSPIGFDLVNELPVFVRCYLERRDAGLDNTWIVKPWNLSRGRGTIVSSNLAMIVKLAYTSPKIVQKYIHQPVLFYRGDIGRVKFDIRYVVFVKSLSPLKLYKYNVFWLRFANKPFTLDQFDEYEKHFTVMNYDEGAELKQIGDLEFQELYKQQYPEHPWEGVDRKVCDMVRECLESAVSLPPPRGMAHSAQSRANYALDFMLKWNEDKTEMVPQLLEFNFNPDHQRAVQYHPEFYNHCLKTFFVEDLTDVPVTLIS